MTMLKLTFYEGTVKLAQTTN